MKWKATQDEAGEEMGEEEPISTTQTDFRAFSSLLLGYFETYPSKHSCIHSYFIPPPFSQCFNTVLWSKEWVGSQQEGSLPAEKEKEGQSTTVLYYRIYCCTLTSNKKKKNR